MSPRHGGIKKPPNLKRRGGTNMTDYEMLNLIISLIGLVLTAILVAKNNKK